MSLCVLRQINAIELDALVRLDEQIPAAADRARLHKIRPLRIDCDRHIRRFEHALFHIDQIPGIEHRAAAEGLVKLRAELHPLILRHAAAFQHVLELVAADDQRIVAFGLLPGVDPVLELLPDLLHDGQRAFLIQRIAQHAAGGRKGFAQAIFQVGGNAGMAVGPLAAAFVVVPYGQASIAWFAPAAAFAACLFVWVGREGFSLEARAAGQSRREKSSASAGLGLSKRALAVFFAILLLLMFSKQVYIATLQNFFTFYLIDAFGLGVDDAQYALFGFLLMSALGTVAGGPLTDRFGRRIVILWSILGAAPFALALPWAGLSGVIVLALIVSFIMSSAFTAILVWALDAAPARIGMVSGLFFGLSFGMGGLATVIFGLAADHFGLQQTFAAASVLPLMGLAAFALPADGTRRRA